ncbi:Zinc knuckle CX2CX4HX4C, partial [Trema orientale]
MSNPLDRYTSAYLLSGYSFNDFRLKSAPSLVSEDGLDDHGRDSNLGLGDGGNDIGLRDISLHGNTAALANLGGVSDGIKGPSLRETAGPNANLGLMTGGSTSSDGGRFIQGPGIAATKSTRVDGAASGLGDVHKVSNVTAAIRNSGLHSKAGYEIVSNDPINSLKEKSFHLSQPDLLPAGTSDLPPSNTKTGLGSGLVRSLSRPDLLQAGPSILPTSIAKSGHGPTFANVVSGLNPQDQIGVNNGSAYSSNILNSKDSLIAPELSKPTIKGNYICVKVNDQPWFPNFNPATQNTTNSQIWVRFYELPWVYWDRQILSDLARGVGVPIRFDEMTLKGDFGHFARILIDIDLSQPLSDSIMVEVGTDCLFIPLEYERLPDFCTACKTIGHVASACRHGKVTVTTTDGEPKVRGRSRSRKRVYRPITKSPKATVVPIKNAFSALKKDLAAESQNKDAEKKLWADDDEVPNEDMDDVNVVKKDVQVGFTNDEDVADVDLDNRMTQNYTSCANPGPDVLVEGTSATFAQQLDPNVSTPTAKSTSDSLNTSDLSPSKVFAYKDEGWQEVQSKKKKKAAIVQA